MSIYGLHEYLKKENLSLKSLFTKNYESFLKKFKLKFPHVLEDEILNFVHIYLIPDDGIICQNGKETCDDKATSSLNDVRVSIVSFTGIYLKPIKIPIIYG